MKDLAAYYIEPLRPVNQSLTLRTVNCSVFAWCSCVKVLKVR